MPPRTPFADVSNNDSTSAPTVNDDATAGWDVGSRWINTTTGRVYFCVDTTVGAAVWKDVTDTTAGHPVNVDTVDPTVTDDANAGFSIGYHWINSTTKNIFQLADDTNGAADWRLVSGVYVEDEGSSLGTFERFNFTGRAVTATDAGSREATVRIPSGGPVGVTLITPTGLTEYTTIASALAAASSGDIVEVGPGTYAESVTIPSGVTLRGSARPLRTTISGAAATGTRVTLGNGANLIGFTITLPTDAVGAVATSVGIGQRTEVVSCRFQGSGGSGIAISMTGTGALEILDCFYDSGTAGSFLSQTAGVVTMLNVTMSAGTLTDWLKITGGTLIGRESAIGGTAILTDCVEVGAASITLEGFVFGGIGAITNVMHVTSDSAFVRMSSVAITNQVATKHILVDPGLTTADFMWLFSEAATTKIDAPGAWLASDGMILSFFDRQTGDERLVLWGHFGVGHQEEGHEATFGEGSSYVRGMVVLTTDSTAGPTSDGGNLTDVTDAASSPVGSTFQFQGTAANHTILFGSKLANATDVFKHWGVNLDVTTGAVIVTPRSFTFEIWNGSAWAAAGSMAIHETFAHRYGNNHLLRSGSKEMILYGVENSTAWAKKTINGLNLYWSRVRINTAITSGPVFQRARLQPNNFKTLVDGTNTYFGRSRFRTTLVAGGNQFGESGQIADFDLTIGSGGIPSGWPHRIKNSQITKSGDAILAQFPLPKGIDTSFPLMVEFTYTVVAGTGQNNADLICSFIPIQVQGVLVADPAGGITPVARTLANTETLTAKAGQVDSTSGQNINTSSNTKLFKKTFGPFDVRNYYEDDWVFVRLELDDEGTDAVDINVVGLAALGVKWAHGAKL